MIIVRLCGGLGNQMFQYAAARSLAYFLNSTLKIDSFQFKKKYISNVTNREFELNKLNISAIQASQWEILKLNQFENLQAKKSFSIFSPILSVILKSKVIRERSFAFDPSIFSHSGNLYLDGYWQSEKYFLGIQELIRREFSIRVPLSKESQIFYEQIKSRTSVSLHVRRGDYILNPETNEFHGVCSLSYYKECIDKISTLVNKPNFYIFSDDPDWAKQNLEIKHPTTFVSSGSGKSYEEMFLMSQCNHHIIANSTFSWWGAWLNQQPNKIVLSPKKWFNRNDIDTSDLIPENWIRI